MAKKKELATRDSTSLEVTEDVGKFLGGGESEFTADDLKVPYLKIIQALSPYMKTKDALYIPDANIGEIIENVSNTRFPGDEGILVVPCAYERRVAEWLPKRGGLATDYGTDTSIIASCTKDAEGRLINPETGNEVSEAAFYYCFYKALTGDYWDQAIITMGGSGWGVARKWNTQMRRLDVRVGGKRIANPKPFCGIYHLTTFIDSNDEGEWGQWHVDFHEFTLNADDGEELLQNAFNFRKLVQKGHVSGHEDQEDEMPF